MIIVRIDICVLIVKPTLRQLGYVNIISTVAQSVFDLSIQGYRRFGH